MKQLSLILIGILCLSSGRAESKKANLFIIGSIHNLHKSQSFTEGKFNSILKNINPGKILLEFPLEWFDQSCQPNQDLKDSLENESQKDGIRDGQLAWSYCQNHNIPCLPYDIKGRNDFFNKNNFFPRLALFQSEIENYVEKNSVYQESYRRLTELMNTCKQDDPITMNGRICDQIFEANESLLYKLYLLAKKENAIKDPDFYQIQEDFWHLRNRTMADQICEFARNSNGQNIAAITGVDHHYYLVKLLSQCPYANLQSWKAD